MSKTGFNNMLYSTLLGIDSLTDPACSILQIIGISEGSLAPLRMKRNLKALKSGCDAAVCLSVLSPLCRLITGNTSRIIINQH